MAPNTRFIRGKYAKALSCVAVKGNESWQNNHLRTAWLLPLVIHSSCLGHTAQKK